jgi:O-antigen/teichoic acid export membrane protein
MLAGSVVKLFVSYLIFPKFPRLHLDFSKIKDLFGYGRWIFWTSVFIFFLTEGDDAFLGKVLGVTALGFYQMAHRISNLPATEITHVISQVTFPAYAKLQDNPHGLREAYLRVLKLTALLSIPVAAGIFVLAPDLTRILLGDKWMPIVPVMQVMVVGGAVRSIGATMGPVFQAVGKPEILTRFLLVQTLLVAAIIYPLTIWLGIVGTGLSMMLPGLVINSVFAYQILKITGVAPGSFFKAIGFPLLASLIMILAVFLLKTFVLPGAGLPAFVLLILLGAGVYFSITYLMELFFDYRIWSVFRSIRTSMSKAN